MAKVECKHLKNCVIMKHNTDAVCDGCGYYQKKGKVYSKVDQGQRIPSDQYQTAYSMVEQLLNVKSFDKDSKILEPAKGKGSIVKVLRKSGYKVTGYDIEQTPNGVSNDDSKYNFLNEKRKFDYIVTNPPFRLATPFIIKASTVCEKEFLFLMPLNYLHGQKRHQSIFKNKKFPFGLNKVWIFTRMPMLNADLRDDGMYNTGMQVYAWYLFTKGYRKEPVLDWIDNSAFVIRKNDKNGGV